MNAIEERVFEAAQRLGGYYRTSRRHVPHFLVEKGRTTYSICWFRKRDYWKVFWPYPGTKTSKVFNTLPEVEEFLESRR